MLEYPHKIRQIEGNKEDKITEFKIKSYLVQNRNINVRMHIFHFNFRFYGGIYDANFKWIDLLLNKYFGWWSKLFLKPR